MTKKSTHLLTGLPVSMSQLTGLPAFTSQLSALPALVSVLALNRPLEVL
jgi:hypothetical protein